MSEASSAECPKSVALRNPALRQYIEIDSSARFAKEATGASFGGPDSGKHLAWWQDVVTTIEYHKLLEANERAKATNP